MSSNTAFDVTVVIPLYNHERYIGETLDSVLKQTRLPEQIIVIDDGSTDSSYEIAREKLGSCGYATVISQKNAGAHAAINRGIEMAKTKFIAVLNSDDNFLPGKIQRAAELISQQALPPDLIFGGVSLIDEISRPIRGSETNNWLDRAHSFLARSGQLDLSLLNENFAVTTSNMLFTKALWKKNGMFQALRYCHDLDFCFASNGNGIILYDYDVKHIQYRVHPTNTIKENLTKVRVELCAVIAAGLINSIIKPLDGHVLEERLFFLEEALNAKGLGNLLPILVAQRAQFDQRSEFYQWVTENETTNRVLMKFLDGNISAAQPRQRYASGLYVSGNEKNISKMVETEVPHVEGPVVVELSSFDRGGLEKVVLDTSLAMRVLGLESIIVSCGKVGHLGEVARKAGIIVYELPAENAENFYAEIIRRHSVKFAISHFSRVGYPVFEREKIPNITFIHNVYAFLNGAALQNFIQDDLYVNAYISVSKNATNYASQKLGINSDKITTIPNGLMLSEHNQRAHDAVPVTRGQFGIADDDYVFLNVASYNLHKGHYLLAAAMNLIKYRTDKIKVLCIGNTVVPHHFVSFKEFLFENNLQNNILLPGYYPDIAPFHAISDAFIMPSFIEGWSIAMNEAMYFGKPLLLTDTGGAAEVIEGDDIGILLPNEYGDSINLDSELLDNLAYHRRSFRTAAHVANGMMRFYENAEYWRNAGANGRSKIIEKYDFKQMVKSYFPVFADVIAHCNGTGK